MAVVCQIAIKFDGGKESGYVVEEGVKEEGLRVVTKKVEEIVPDDLIEYDGIMVGSPCYYGSLADALPN